MCYLDDLLLPLNIPQFISSLSRIVESKKFSDKQMMSVFFTLINASIKATLSITLRITLSITSHVPMAKAQSGRFHGTWTDFNVTHCKNSK